MWYVIQTTTGKEAELTEAIERQLPAFIYKNCFITKRELLKRFGGEWVRLTENLFPSYIFIEAEDAEALFFALRKLPEYAKILGNKCGSGEREFIPLESGEEEYLKSILDSDHTVRLSKVSLDEAGRIVSIDGPLAFLQEQIVKLNLRKRYAIVALFLEGEVRTAMLGIEIGDSKI